VFFPCFPFVQCSLSCREYDAAPVICVLGLLGTEFKLLQLPRGERLVAQGVQIQLDPVRRDSSSIHHVSIRRVDANHLLWKIASREIFFFSLVNEEESLSRAHEVPLPPFGSSCQLAPKFPHITLTQRGLDVLPFTIRINLMRNTCGCSIPLYQSRIVVRLFRCSGRKTTGARSRSRFAPDLRLFRHLQTGVPDPPFPGLFPESTDRDHGASFVENSSSSRTSPSRPVEREGRSRVPR